MGRTINKETIALIKKFEGCRLTSYQDSVGVWTIGYGHTAGVKRGMKISQVQAEKYLTEDLKKYSAYVDRYVTTFTPNDNQYGALTSFCYNCGAGSLKTLVTGRNAEIISEKILLYNKAGGKVLNGLTKRRAAEQKLFNKSISESKEKKSTKYSHMQFVKDVQKAIGAKVDGIAGNETLSKTVTVSKTKNNKHAVVKPIQKYLNSIGYNCGVVDGIAGTKFDGGVKAFQKANGCIADGEITAKNRTWKKLLEIT